jgi:hypothetical protein
VFGNSPLVVGENIFDSPASSDRATLRWRRAAKIAKLTLVSAMSFSICGIRPTLDKVTRRGAIPKPQLASVMISMARSVLA